MLRYNVHDGRPAQQKASDLRGMLSQRVALGEHVRALTTPTIPPELLEAARTLDLHYLPTHYPNGHAAGAPGEHYGKLQSDEAIRCAGQIIDFCRLQMAGS